MDVEINFKGTIMKTLEHEIRDVMSRKKEKDLIEEVNNNFINLVNTLYEEELTEEQFVTLYEAYINYLIERDGMLSKAWNLIKNNPKTSSAIGVGAVGGSQLQNPPSDGVEDTLDATRLGLGAAGLASSRFTGAAAKAAKFIPGVSTAVGLGTAAYRAYKGDYTGAGLAAGSAIPGPVGWGFSAADMARGALGHPDASASPPNPATPPNTDNKSPAAPAATPPPVSPPGSKEKSPIAVDPLSGTVTNISNDKKQQPLDKKQIEYTDRGFSQTPTPASTNVSRQPEMKTPLAGGATDSRMSVPTPPKTTQPDTKPVTTQPASTPQPSTSTKSQEPPESARKQKPSTSSDSSYSGRSIGDYGKDNSWVQPAFNRG